MNLNDSWKRERVHIFGCWACWFNMSWQAGINTSEAGLTVNRYISSGKGREFAFFFSHRLNANLGKPCLWKPGNAENVLAISETCTSCMFLQFLCCKVVSPALACHPHNPATLWNNWPNLWADAITVILHHFTLQNNKSICGLMQLLWFCTNVCKWSEEADYPTSASCSLRWNNWDPICSQFMSDSLGLPSAQKIEPFAADLCQT